MAPRRVLFAAQDRDAELLDTLFQTPDPLQERRRPRDPLVDHVPVPVVAGGVVRVAAQLLAEEQILEAGAVQGRLERFSVELGRVARMRARTNVDHHLNAVRLQQRQQRLRVLIRVPDREEPFGQRRVLPADATSPNPLPAAKPMRLYRIGHAPATAAQKSLAYLNVVPGTLALPVPPEDIVERTSDSRRYVGLLHRGWYHCGDCELTGPAATPVGRTGDLDALIEKCYGCVSPLNSWTGKHWRVKKSMSTCGRWEENAMCGLRLRQRAVLMAVALVIASCSFSLWAEPVGPSTDSAVVAELRRIILEHAAQFRSFAGTYKLVQDTRDGGLWEPEFECRVQGKNLYLDMQEGQVSSFDGRDSGLRQINTVYDGVISERLDVDGSTGVTLGKKNGWMAPDMAYMDPRVLFLEIYGKTAAEWMASGTDTVHYRDGMRVLSHLMDWCSCSYDVYIDDAGLIRKLEYSMRLLEPDEEVRRYWSGDLFDVRRVERAWEFDAHQLINGVMCPTVATATWYAHDDAISESLWTLEDSAQISQLEAWVRNYVENPEMPAVEQTFEFIDVSNVLFNVPLDRTDFELEIPVGAHVLDEVTGFHYVAQPKRWYQRIPSEAWVGMGLILVLTLVTLGGWGLWRRYA